MTGSGKELDGFTIGVTAYRRADDLTAALVRRGAGVVHAPVLEIASVAEDTILRSATRTVIDAQPDAVVVTTAYGVRRWLEAADADGVMDDLTATIDRARLMVRGPKARGAARSLGLDDSSAVEGELTEDLVRHLIADQADSPRPLCVAVQIHSYMDRDQLARLQEAGANVVVVEPYRWVAGADAERVDRLIDEVLAHRIDALTFTSAPAVDAFVGRALETGRGEALLGCLRRRHVVCAAVGPVTAGPLIEAGIDPIVPERHRLGALVRTTGDWLVEHRTARVDTGEGLLELRARSARLAGRILELPPSALRILVRLAETPDRLVARAELLELLPAGSAPHSVDTAISRLRSALGGPAMIRTVVRRGYVLDTAAGRVHAC